MEFNNGLILQFGENFKNGGTLTIILPLVYNDRNYKVICNPVSLSYSGSGGGSTSIVQGINTTDDNRKKISSFYLDNSTYGGVYWISIGY